MANQQQNNYKKLGVIWKKTSQAGRQFYSGVLNLKEIGYDKDVPIVLFENINKRPDRQDPDWQIFLSMPREGQGQAQSAAPRAKTASVAKAKPVSAPAPAPTDDPEEDDNGVL